MNCLTRLFRSFSKSKSTCKNEAPLSLNSPLSVGSPGSSLSPNNIHSNSPTSFIIKPSDQSGFKSVILDIEDDDFSINEIIKIPILREALMKFVRDHDGSYDKFSLYNEIQQYKSITSSTKRENIARAIYDKYLDKNSKECIWFENILLKELELKWGEPYMFEDVEGVLRNEMINVYKRWSDMDDYRKVTFKYLEYIKNLSSLEENKLL